MNHALHLLQQVVVRSVVTVGCLFHGFLVSEACLFAVNNVENDNSESEDVGLAISDLDIGQLIVDILSQVQRSSSIEILILGDFDGLGESEVSEHGSVLVHHEDISLFQIEMAYFLVVKLVH